MEEARPRRGEVRFEATRGQRAASFQAGEASHSSATTAGPAETSLTCGGAEI